MTDNQKNWHEATKRVVSLLKYEPYILAIALIGLVLKTYNQEYGSLLTTIALCTLAILYFYKAYVTVEDEQASVWEYFFSRVTSIASSVVLFGVLFGLQHWPGDKAFLIAGGITLLISLPFLAYYRNKRPDTRVIDGVMLLRTLILLIVVTLMLLWLLGLIFVK